MALAWFGIVKLVDRIRAGFDQFFALFGAIVKLIVYTATINATVCGSVVVVVERAKRNALVRWRVECLVDFAYGLTGEKIVCLVKWSEARETLAWWSCRVEDCVGVSYTNFGQRWATRSISIQPKPTGTLTLIRQRIQNKMQRFIALFFFLVTLPIVGIQHKPIITHTLISIVIKMLIHQTSHHHTSYLVRT